MEQLSRRSIKAYLPVIEAIYASLEVSYRAHTERIEQFQSLRLIHLERQFGTGRLLEAGDVISVWLRGSPFKVEALHIHKLNPSAKWADFFTILDKKITEYQNGDAVIELTITDTGHTVRVINGKELVYDFAGDGKKKELLFHLLERGDGFAQNAQIQNIIKSKSKDSVAKTIGKINLALGSALQLPQEKHIIESKRGSGYRINPIYNLIRVD